MRARWRTWGLVLGCWTVVSLVYSSHLYFFHRWGGEPTTWRLQLAEALADFYVWAALTPVVVLLAEAVPLERAHWLRAVLVHVPASLVVSFVQVSIHTVVDLGLIHGHYGSGALADGFEALFARTFHFGLLVYFTIAGVRWALEYYKNQQVRAAQLETHLARARLEALEMQLHPHFLFNTLHAVSALMHRDVDAADRMIARLSELLRMTLDTSGGEEISLRREMQLLEKYLEIEQTRFHDRLAVDLRIAPEVLDARVPSLLLQPLVENAIRHGVSKRRGAGRIEIDAHRTNGQLTITVSDDGVGLPASGAGDGIGLTNTRQRLEQLYGDRHRFELRNRPEGGLEATIAIPFRPAGEEKSEWTRSAR